MARVVISVGAQAERSLVDVVRPMVDSMKRARKASEADAAAIGRSLAREANRAANQAAQAYRQIEAASARAAKKAVSDADRATRERVRAEQRVFDAELRLAMQKAAIKKKIAADEERDIMRTAAAAHKADRAKLAGDIKAGQARGQRVLDVGAGAARTFGGVARSGYGVARDTLRGAGVDFDLGTLVSRGVAIESAAARTATSAATAKGRTTTPEEIKANIAAIKDAGNEAALDFNMLAAGFEDFVAKSADAATGKDVLKDLGLTARATGAEVDKLVSAAGDVSRVMGDTPDKAQRLLAIMRLVAKQGAMGNVEVKDMASYIGRMTSSGFMFEGSIDKNIGVLGAMSQVAMTGGATSAADATRAADAFSRDITKGAALKRFKEAGIEIFSDASKTKLRGPEAIITDFYRKTGGNLEDLASLFQNEMSKKVVKGFSKIASDAKERGEDPLDAIKNEFSRFTTTMTAGEVNRAAAVSKGTTEARAQAFNNKLAETAATMADRLLPALERLAPKAIDAAEAMGGVAGWAAENPGSAITAAIVGSIAKAGVGNVLSTVLADQIKKGVVGVGSAGLVGLIVAEVGMAFAEIEKVRSGAKEGGAAALDTSRRAYDVSQGAQAKMARGEALNVGDVSTLFQQRVALMGQEFKAGTGAEYQGSFGTLKGLWDSVTGNRSAKDQFEGTQARELSGLDSATAAKLDALIAAVQANKPPTEVTVKGGMPLAQADPTGVQH